MLRFLTDGQEHYFFDLHRFNSDSGRLTFEKAKFENAEKLKKLATRLRTQALRPELQIDGRHMLAGFRQIVAAIA